MVRGWAEGCHYLHCGQRLICMSGQRFPVGDPFPSIFPPQKGGSPSAVKIACLCPPIRNLQERTQICSFNTTWAQSGAFTVIKPGEAEEWGLLFAGDTQRKPGLHCRPVRMNKVVREFAACGLGAATVSLATVSLKHFASECTIALLMTFLAQFSNRE